jgi:putative transposase
MVGLELKTHYSVYEYAEFGVSGLPKAPKNIQAFFERNKCKARKRQGRGGGVEYELASLPMDLQTEIRNKFAEVVVATKPKQLPTVKNLNLADLTTKQREIADARMALVAYVSELEQVQSRIKAITHLCNAAKCGEISEDLMALISKANSKNGNNCGRVLSPRTLNQWVIDYHKCKTAEERLRALAPSQRQADKVESIWWMSWFMGIYRQTNGISVMDAYRIFETEWLTRHENDDMLREMLPSLDRVRRALAKLPLHIREFGRLTGSKYKGLLPYVERDWSLFKANDIWIGDGHSLKMKVAHPIHGRPFTPELTMIIDGASRKIVGWSLALSESAFAVLDALRHAISQHGLPCIYYSDNGGGEKNILLDADVTGILPRFSIHHATGIAGNPQGRGIIERLNKTVGKRIAQRFQTYYGADADPDSKRRMLQSMISLSNAKKGAVLTPLQRKAKEKLVSWEELMVGIQEVIDWYNNEHVHSEIRCTPAVKYERVTNPELIVYLSDVELRDIERPHFKRVTKRGLIEWKNHKYFNLELLNHQGKEVVVGVDIHNADFVQVRTLDGRFICNAEFEAHKKAAFPMPMVEQQRENRAKGRLNRIKHRENEILDELNPVITIEHQQGAELLHSLRAKQVNRFYDDEEIPLLPSEMRRQQRKIAGVK